MLENAMRLRFGAVSALILGLLSLYLFSAREVRVLIDGAEFRTQSHARSVGQVLQEMGIRLSPGDQVLPAQDTLVSNLPHGSIEVQTAFPAVLTTDGTSRSIKTTNRAPLNLLLEQGYPVYPSDRVWVDGLEASYYSPITLQRVELDQAVPFLLVDEGKASRLNSSAATIGQALHDSGVLLFEGDQSASDLAAPLTQGMRIDIERSTLAQILVDDQALRVRVSGGEVGEALSQSGITLQGLDYAVPGLSESIPNSAPIRVVRVSEKIQIEQTPLPFLTNFQPIPELEIDNQQLLQAGSFGVLANRIRIRHEDGEEVSTITEGEWIAREPDPEILGYGTGIVIRTVGTADGNLEYWRAVEMWATSYSPANAGIPEGHPWYGITASGKPLRKGLVAIDRSLIPFGTMMYVNGYGFAEAADTGGGVKGRWIDLGYLDDEYVPWASWVTVYFLTPLPPAQNIVWIFP
jgi:uncharacterized protein YabE (DUF348 family)